MAKKLFTQEELDAAIAKARDGAFQQRDDAMRQVEAKMRRDKAESAVMEGIIAGLVRDVHYARSSALIRKHHAVDGQPMSSIIVQPPSKAEFDAIAKGLQKAVKDGHISLHPQTSRSELAVAG